MYYIYKYKFRKKYLLLNDINLFGMKIENKKNKSSKTVSINGFETELFLLNNQKILDTKIYELLINFCVKKGNKQLALKDVKKSFMLIRKFFSINPFFLIRLILINSESVFILQRYFRGKREIIKPRFIEENKKIKYVLRMLVNRARELQKEYKYLFVSLTHAILEFVKLDNILNSLNKETNELAETNKYLLYKKKYLRRKIRLFRKINHWK